MVDVSVIVPSYEAAGTIADCLSALRGQRTSATYEVIVVDSGGDGTSELVASRFPEVRLVDLPQRAFPGGARSHGIAIASGPILAFTDADCLPAPDWVDAVAAAHRERAVPVIGGVVDDASERGLVAAAYHFTEFHRWLPGRVSGAVDDVPGCCWSMKRGAYERWGPFRDGRYCEDTVFHWHMARDGERPVVDPAIRVAHRAAPGLRRCLAHEQFHGRSFARVRAEERRMSRAEALIRAATAPALPFLLFARAARSVAVARSYRRRFALSAPLVLLAMASWSLGEARGYAAAAAGR